MISGIIKVEVSVISRAEGQGSPDNTCRDLHYLEYHKTESNNCFIIHCFEEKERQTHPRKEPELILPFGNHALLAQPTD